MSKKIDRDLIDAVQAEVNTGAKVIVIPGPLLAMASEEAFEKVRQICEICRVRSVNVHFQF